MTKHTVLPHETHDSVKVANYLSKFTAAVKNPANGFGVSTTDFFIDKELVGQVCNNPDEAMRTITTALMQRAHLPGSSWDGLNVPMASLTETKNGYSLRLLGHYDRFPAEKVAEGLKESLNNAQKIVLERIATSTGEITR